MRTTFFATGSPATLCSSLAQRAQGLFSGDRSGWARFVEAIQDGSRDRAVDALNALTVGGRCVHPKQARVFCVTGETVTVTIAIAAFEGRTSSKLCVAATPVKFRPGSEVVTWMVTQSLKSQGGLALQLINRCGGSSGVGPAAWR